MENLIIELNEELTTELISTLHSIRVGAGHHKVSMNLEGNVIECTTTNMSAIDAGFDNCYDDDDNSLRFYETQREAQEALIHEVLRKNDIQF